VPTFTSFDEMAAKAKPDLLMVTTVDGYHSEYIVRGLDRGMDVLTEKPMVIDETQCQAVLDAEKRSGRKIVVTFNYHARRNTRRSGSS
jgi:predicted dehydrogenase